MLHSLEDKPFSMTGKKHVILSFLAMNPLAIQAVNSLTRRQAVQHNRKKARHSELLSDESTCHTSG